MAGGGAVARAFWSLAKAAVAFGSAGGRTGPASACTVWAKLSVSFNTHGAKSTVAFTYGKTTKYTARTKAHTAKAATVTVSYKKLIKGLKPGKTYHVRAVVTNRVGKAVGKDFTFKTTAAKKKKHHKKH